MWVTTVRYLPYVLAGLGAVALVTLVLGTTYQKGYKASETKWRLKWAEMETERAEYMTAQAVKMNRALAHKHTQQASIAEGMNDIEIPDTATCTDSQWLRSHNDAVRVANGS